MTDQKASTAQERNQSAAARMVANALDHYGFSVSIQNKNSVHFTMRDADRNGEYRDVVVTFQVCELPHD